MSCGRCDKDQQCSKDGLCQAIPQDKGKLFGVAVEALDPDAIGDTPKTIAGATIGLDGVDAASTDDLGYYELLVRPGQHTVSGRKDDMTGEKECTVLPGSYKECNITLSRPSRDDDKGSSSGGCSTAAGLHRMEAAWTALLLYLLLWPARRRQA